MVLLHLIKNRRCLLSECNLQCQNCGTLNENTCTCACAPGWDGGDCSSKDMLL